MSHARSLTPEENERVCSAVASLMERYNSQGELAKALIMPDGTHASQMSVSMALRRLPVGVSFARAVARQMGRSVEELLNGVVGRPGLQKNKDLPGWPEAAKVVLEQELLPPYAVTSAGEHLVSFPIKGEVDPGFVYDMGMLWIKYAPMELRKAAEKALMLEEERKIREEQERYEERTKSGSVTIDRRSHVAPLVKSKGNR